MKSDTIAAIATALSDSGISIVRVSGEDAIKKINDIFVNKKGEHILDSVRSHTIHYGFIVSNGETVDEVMVSEMKAPNSFTREDVVEINCHGGVFVSKAVLSTVLSTGIRLAEPGEFTKRAFLNGRIDLSKAEAVMDLISAESKAGLTNSLRHLNGDLYNKIVDLRKAVLYEIAFIESALDDPEHISLEGYPEKLKSKVEDIKKETDALKDTFDRGKIIKEGIKTVILGKPNVGKSSLLNILTGYDRAIVTDVAGTTRDTIEERVSLGDVFLNLTDTAGIRESSDIVENIGVSRALKYADEADLILFIVDSSDEADEEDLKIYKHIEDKKKIVLLNKTDLSTSEERDRIRGMFSGNDDIIEISCTDRTGFDELKDKINNDFLSGRLRSDNELVITNLRQAEKLSEASESLKHVLDAISDGMPEDFYSIDLMNAYAAYGNIIGEEIDDDLANEIFSKFCMGK